MENKTYKEGIKAEHGLSIYIETDEMNILFDAGATDSFLSNAGSLGIDLARVDMAVISHGHYDHTGGFPGFCRVNKKASVYVHRNAFRRSFGYKGTQREEKMSGIRWSRQEREAMGERLVFTEGPLMITDNICITGTVPVCLGFTPSEKFYIKHDSGNLEEDDMSHEQCLVIRERSGLYIFSGCSHRGAVSALRCGQSMFPGERTAAFVCGTHLYSASKEAREKTVRELAEGYDGILIPVHCTGMEAICDFKAAMGDRCVPLSAGDVFHGC